MKIRLRQVEGFLALAEDLSFSRAAKRLGMTQPAFSQMIRELESALELNLFERTTRRVALLPAGAQLRDQMQRGMTHLEAACRNAQALARLEQGQLAVATLPSLACGLVLPVISRFREQYPGISLRLYEDHNRQILDKLTAGDVELAVGSAMPGHDHLQFTPLLEDELVCVLPVAHRLSRQSRVAWRDLTRETLILVAATSQTYRTVRANLAQWAGDKQPECETLNSVTAVSMVRAGLGLTLIPEIALGELNMTGLTYRRLGAPRPSRQVGLFRQAAASLSPGAQAFQRLLGQVVREHRDPAVRPPTSPPAAACIAPKNPV